VIVKSDGSIYFTDPGGPLAPDQFDVTVAGVYRVSADLGSTSLIIDDLIGPNGLAFSPDEEHRFTSLTLGAVSFRRDLLPNGRLRSRPAGCSPTWAAHEPGVPTE
jgi:sugar lactone lactonase YvrE